MNLLYKKTSKVIERMKSNKIFIVLMAITFGFFLPNSAKATHIVGGDISYKCLGFNQYEITLTIRRDCDNGEEPFDKIAKVGIFDGYGNLIPWLGVGGLANLENPQIDTIDTALSGGCEFIGSAVCVEQAVYKGTVTLPFRNYGYYLAHQRCCRNVSLTNIIDPLLSGSTYYTQITEDALTGCNDSPSFNKWPDLYICANQTLTFDHSASEADGDSLVYSLCDPKLGASFEEPNPTPPAGPPYDNVVFKPPFSANDPMGGIPLQIDSKTGVLTANPNAIGQYLVGVCVKEYRNGKLISTTIRDFEYNVRVCTEGPVAAFEAPDLTCDGLTVEFNNQSTGADAYKWSFNVPSNDPVFTSTDVNPTFTFPTEGNYVVSLEAIRNIDGCSSTVYDTIGVYTSEISASFEYNLENCVPDSTNFQFTDTSTDPEYPITSWIWEFSDNNGFSKTINDQNPLVSLPVNDEITVKFTAISESGCSSTLTKVVDADVLDLEILASPARICQGDSTAILLDANCDVDYSIVPTTNTYYNEEDCNIYIVPFENQSYTIYATNGICSDSTKLDVEVIEKSDINIEGDFNSCSDSIIANVIGGLEGNQFEWSLSDDFSTLIGDMTENLAVEFPNAKDTVIVFCRVKEGTGCSDIVSAQFINNSLMYEVPEEFQLCEGENEEVIIVNNGNHDIVVTWEDNPFIVSVNNNKIVIFSDVVGAETVLKYKISNEFGCEAEGEIKVTVGEKPTIDFSFQLDCDDFGVCFTNTSTGDNAVHWDFGDLTTEDDTSTEQNPCYEYPEPGTYNVTLTLGDGACEGFSVTKEVIVPNVLEVNLNQDAVDICKYGQPEFSVDVNRPMEDIEITWSVNGDIVAENILVYTGTYTETTTVIVVVKDKYGCEISREIQVNVYPFDIDLDFPDVVCADDTVTVKATNNSQGNNFTYEWIPEENIISGNGTTEVMVNASNPTEISLIVTNEDNSCKDTFSFELNVSVIDADLYVNPEEPYQCTEAEIGVSDPDSDWTFIWDNGETTESFMDSVMQNTTYTVTITDENGCTAVESIEVVVQLPQCDETDVFVPTAFSPNGDGTNDILYVRSNYIKKMEFQIYNRWGELMFRSTDKSIGWDGMYEGKLMSPDVYAFSLQVTCSNGATYQKLGNVTLIR